MTSKVIITASEHSRDGIVLSPHEREVSIFRLQRYHNAVKTGGDMEKIPNNPPIKDTPVLAINLRQSDIPDDMFVQIIDLWHDGLKLIYAIEVGDFSIEFNDKSTATEYYKTLLGDFPDHNVEIGYYNTALGI